MFICLLEYTGKGTNLDPKSATHLCVPVFQFCHWWVIVKKGPPSNVEIYWILVFVVVF